MLPPANERARTGWKTWRLLVLIGVLVLSAGAAAIIWMKYSPRGVPPGQPPLVILAEDDLRPVEQAFNAGAANKRVVVMLSPT